MLNFDKICKHFRLEELPEEGGFFKRIYTSDEMIIPSYTDENRAICTSIYYLLKSGRCSNKHRLKQDEQWFFLMGNPIVLTEYEAYESREIIIGRDILNGEKLHHTIKAGRYFEAKSCDGDNDYSLIAAVCSPGFDYKDFELGG